MTAASKPTGRTMSLPKGIGLAGLASLVLTLLLSAVLAKLLDAQKVTWEQAGYWIMVMLFLSAFLGSGTAITVIRRQRLTVSVMAGGLYWAALLAITALFFGGNYEAVPETALIIIAGSGCAAMLSQPRKPRRRGVAGKRKL